MSSPRPRGYIEPPPRAQLVEFAGAAFDEEEMTMADQAVAKVLMQYPTLLADQMAKLRTAWTEAPEVLNRETVAPVFAIAHDLAGYGDTFGYPLVTIFARSLCRLLKMGDLSRGQMGDVVEAHIATLHAIVRDHIQGSGGALGLSLGAGLDQAIAKFHLASGTNRAGRLGDEIAALQPKK